MRTFVEKILNAERGSIVVREPDYVMSHDNSARVRFLFERIHGTRVYNPSQLVIVLDGKVSGLVNELSLEYNSIRDFVEEQGIEHFYDCDRGISHQIISELIRMKITSQCRMRCSDMDSRNVERRERSTR